MNKNKTDELRQILQKPIVIYTLVALLIAAGAYGAVYSFSSNTPSNEQGSGAAQLKAIPQAHGKTISHTKTEAKQRDEERTRLKSLAGRNDNWSDGVMGLIDNRKVELPDVETKQEASLRQSRQSANDVQEVVTSFYRRQDDTDLPDNHLLDQNEKLRRELEIIQQREKIAVEQTKIAQQAVGVVQTVAASQGIALAPSSTYSHNEADPHPANGKLLAMAVAPSGDQTVSSLQQSRAEGDAQELNRDFHTAIGEDPKAEAKNTIRAVVEQTLVVRENQTVQLRLKEEIRIGSRLIPRNAIVVAQARLQRDRLELTVQSIAHQGTILPIDLRAYDTDGQPGLYVPGSIEANAVQEIAANSGDALSRGGMTFSTQGAGTQIVADAARGVLSGASQYMKKKIREVKITLKAGTELLLLPAE